MALTAAERAKRYRDKKKQTTDSHNEYLKKERDRYYQRKAKGEYSFSDKSSREMNLLRRKWRYQKREGRKQMKMREKAQEFLNSNTPEASPVRVQEDELNIQEHHVENNNPPPPAQQYLTPNNKQDKTKTPQSLSGKKRTKRNQQATRRLIQKLAEEKDYFRKLWERSRKKLRRLELKKSQNRHIRIAMFIDRRRRKHRQQTKNTPLNRQRMLRNIVKQFLEEDVNSSLAPGKKDTITLHKVKKQKRYLNDTLKTLYERFTKQYAYIQLSYVSFSRLRPFWIIQKTVEQRDTCLCKLHENVRLRIEKLKQVKVITETDPNKVAESLVCNIENKECAYRDCTICSNADIKLDPGFSLDRMGHQVTFDQWTNRSESVSGKDGSKTVQKTVKQTEQCSIEVLVEETQALLKEKYLRHIFNVKHQYKSLKSVKENLDETEAVVHVDFSENYNCKLAGEVQAMHFGGSRNQISLHTVVVYTQSKTESFCTVSENTSHGPAAIWAHMEPIIKHLKESGVTTVHFISDGPCTQYRSKNHFFMFNEEIINNHQFEHSTWNFTESGHGKSAADGIGATVKRTADRLVANGHDITNADTFYKIVKEQLLKVQLVLIENSEIDKNVQRLPKDLVTIKGALKLHQVAVHLNEPGMLQLKVLSCFCKWPEKCACYLGEPSMHKLPLNTRSMTVDSETESAAPENVTTTATNTVDHPQETEVAVEPEASNLESASTSTDVTSVSTTVDLQETSNDKRALITGLQVTPDPELIGSWCVVSYEKNVYPGIIQDLDDESAEVKCMCRVGVNRYFWPLIDDIIWYKWKDIIMLIPEPKHVTSRHVQIDPLYYDLLS